MDSQRNPKKLSSTEKAALILLALGEDLAAQIIGAMNREDVAQVARALQKTERVDQKILDQVLVDFYDEIQKLQKNPVKNPAQFMSSLEKSLKPEIAAMFHQNVDWATPSLMATLEKIQAKPLATYLQSEHPQTVAIIMAHLQAQKAGQVLKMLPEATRVSIIQRLASLGPVGSEAIADLEESLKNSLRESLGKSSRGQDRNGHPLGGAQKVADLLSHLDRDASAQLLGELKGRDQTLFQDVQEKLFRFVDLVKIESKDLVKVLQVIPPKTLLIALKDCPPPVYAAIQKMMSPRAWSLIQEDLAAMAPVRLAEVEKAQQEILKVVRHKIDSGEIQVRDSREIYV